MKNHCRLVDIGVPKGTMKDVPPQNFHGNWESSEPRKPDVATTFEFRQSSRIRLFNRQVNLGLGCSRLLALLRQAAFMIIVFPRRHGSMLSPITYSLTRQSLVARTKREREVQMREPIVLISTPFPWFVASRRNQCI